MALPTLSKTWDVDPNTAGGTGAGETADYQATLFAIKNALVGGGNVSNPWTVISSSDAVTADATDRWVNAADLVASAGNHSWIVLEDPTGDHQICIDLAGASQPLMNLVWSPSGVFTGGTIGARPTAADEHVRITTAQNWLANNAGAHTSKVHVQVSTDGQASYIFVSIAGVTQALWLFCELDNPPTGLTDPTLIHMEVNTTIERGSMARFALLGNNRMDDGGVLISPRLSIEATLSGVTPSRFNSEQLGPSGDSGDNPLGGIGVWGDGSTAQRGKKGNLPDMFWALELLNSGDQYPDAPTLYQFTQFGDVVVAWDSLTQVEIT